MMKLSLKPILILLCLISLSAFVGDDEPLAWTFRTAGPVVASPVFSDGLIYIGSMDSTFYALDVHTGKEQWRFRTGDEISSTAALYNSMIYFESGNILYAVNRKGKLQWKYILCSETLNKQADPWDFHHSSPVVHQGVVYIGTEKGLLLGIDAKSGERVFLSQTLSEQAIRSTPVVHDGLVMYGDWEGVFYASHIKDASLAWKYDTKKDGTFFWVNAIHGSPLVKDDRVYFAGRSCRLYSLDVRTGEKNWHYSSPTDQWLLGSPVVADGMVYVGSSDQHLFHAINLENGELLWTADMDGRTWGKPFVKGDHIYIGGNSFYILQKATGKIVEELSFPQVHEDRNFGEYVDRCANFHSSPLVYKDMAIVGSDDGYVYGISLVN